MTALRYKELFLTFNIKAYFPDKSLGIAVITPGQLLSVIRCRLAMQIILRVMLEMIFCVTACSLLQHLLREHQHEMA